MALDFTLLFQSAESYKAFRDTYILKWSFWVWMSTCANIQAGNYIQVLWEPLNRCFPKEAQQLPGGQVDIGGGIRVSQSFEPYICEGVTL